MLPINKIKSTNYRKYEYNVATRGRFVKREQWERIKTAL